MKEQTKRQYQIGEKIKRALSNMFISGVFEGKIKDIFSFTEVSPSAGYQTAFVFISALDKNKNKEIVDTLNKMSNEIRYELANSIQLRYTPTLIFKYDYSLDYASRINELLNSDEVKIDLE